MGEGEHGRMGENALSFRNQRLMRDYPESMDAGPLSGVTNSSIYLGI